MVTPHRDAQRAYFGGADARHFAWQTASAYFAATEAALVAQVGIRPGERLLEIGCGEGANLHHLRGQGGHLAGLDFVPAKARFAAQVTRAAIVCGDSERLPFAGDRFDVILIRDLLHHVADRPRVLGEALRVTRPGGRIVVIEPNRWNPLVCAQALAVRAERGLLASTGERLTGELGRAGWGEVRLERAQPLPLSRLILHPRFGAPRLGEQGAFARALGTLERAFAGLPQSIWAYMVARGKKDARSQG